MTPYDMAYQLATPHGVLAAFHIPDSPEPVPEQVLDRLHPLEAEHARTLRKYRQVSYVGGRLALRAASVQVGIQPAALLTNDRGAAILPDKLVGSISHKRTLAVGMVARADGGTLGVDLEEYGPARPGIAERVLRPDELAAVQSLPPDRAWVDTVLRFSLKESIYKALDPYVRRYVKFTEAEVWPGLDGTARAELHLEGDEGPFKIDARYDWLHGRVLTSVRIQRSTAPDA